MQNSLFIPSLQDYVKELISETEKIEAFRKHVIEISANFISITLKTRKKANVMFVCTHNSRRSHLSQIWAQTAAAYYGYYPQVQCFSGGTEATAFYKSAVEAVNKAGFDIQIKESGHNPRYEITYSKEYPPLEIFSKRFDDSYNPQEDFIAIVNCSQADESCPQIAGTAGRFSLLYQDPKKYDGTDLEQIKYEERCKQIATEMFYLFSKI